DWRKSLKGIGCVVSLALTDTPVKKRTQIQACSIIQRTETTTSVVDTTTVEPLVLTTRNTSKLSDVLEKIRKNIKTFSKDAKKRCGGLCALETEACQLVDRRARRVRVCRLLTLITCGEDEWRCRNGLCVDAAARCDGTIQCYDRSDEIHCGSPKMSQIPPMESLDCEGEPASLGLRWEKWKRGLELYLIATNVTTPEAKRAMLLHMGGLALQEVYFNIPGAHVDAAVEGKDLFDVALSKLDDYFAPKQSRVYERHLFRLVKQESGEKFEKYLVRLRHQCSKCKFTSPDEQMIDQITEKCDSVELRKKILTLGDDVTLDKIISEANALETVQRQLNNFDAIKPNRDLPVNQVGMTKRKEHPAPASCCRCRGNHPSDSKYCPARDKKCLKCGFIGHFRTCCRTRANKRKSDEIPAKEDGVRGAKRQKTKPVEEVDYIFHIDGDDTITCTLGDVQIDMLIDSGSKCNIISDVAWENLKSSGIRVENQIKNPDKKLMAYGSDKPLNVLGSFDSIIIVGNGKPLKATFFVVQNGTRNLLGKDTATKLGVLRIGLGINAIDGTFPKFRGVQIHIPIDTSVKPVSQPCRRVPIPLEAKINKKIQELIDTDIIEPVDGPSDWISPLVPVLKGDGDVRICVDMRRANLAIIREKYPLPTMEQLLPKFRNAKVFSKLDLKNSFHQLELSQDSRYITTFICSHGLYRYKRLMFGISCAPECFQKNLERLLLHCEGVVNFIDDIVVFGSNEAEHETRLSKTLQVLHDNDVLLNDDKCVLRAKRIEFLGHQLTCDGVKPLDKLSSGDPSPCPFDDDNYVNLVVDESLPTALSLSELKRVCENDQELALVRNGLYNQVWDQNVQNYKIFEHELCFQDELLLRGNKVVIPSSLRSKVLIAAHEGKPPAELFYKRQFRDKLPSIIDVEFADTDMETRDRDTEQKQKGKEYADRKRHATESDIGVGEKVYVKNMTKDNKLTAPFNDTPHTVITKNGGDVELQNDDNGQLLRRNIVHLKRIEGQWKVCPEDDNSVDNAVRSE
ncbi:unnamed protein product, partial [Plutella xylostella]